MNVSLKVVNFQYEDTGIEGHIQLYTQFKNNFHVKFFEDLTDYNNYLTISLNDFTITDNTLNISEHKKKMIIKYIMKNVKHIFTYYHHGLYMDCSQLLELYEQFQALTPQDVNACLAYKI
jgi:hypothetical protein